MAMFTSPARKCLEENAPLYYPLGGKLSRDVLEYYYGTRNTIKILFLGCQDLRNVLQTVGSKTTYDTNFSIHLNHPCPLLCARNVLILQVISAPTFDVNNPKDIDYLWDLWYNLQWPQSTLLRFEKDVKRLIETGLKSSKQFHFLSSQLDDLIVLLKDWLLSLKKLTLPSQMKGILNERLEFINRGGLEVMGQIVVRTVKNNPRTIPESLKLLAGWRNSAMDIENFPEVLKKKLTLETLSYFQMGTCNSSETKHFAALNPTLLEPKTLTWRVDVTSCPFDTYLPLDLKELETSAQGGIATRFCQKILQDLVLEFRKKNTTFHFHLSDNLKPSLPECKIKFDVIDCSSLADEVGLANLVVPASQKLESHQHALLITESYYWGSVASTVALYLEESLCAPLSMIPTIYGLRVTNQIELGFTTLMEKDCPVGYPPVTLDWRQAPRFENVFLNYSPTFTQFLLKLKDKCFINEEDRNLIAREKCGLKRYTPLTFSSIVTNLAEVMKKEEQFKLKQEVEPHFALAYKTQEDWAQGRPITQVTAVQPFTPVVETLFIQNQMLIRAPWLRLILVPSDLFTEFSKKRCALKLNIKKIEINWADEIPRVHYIDNFVLHWRKNEHGSFSSVQVSFLLPKNHGLEKTHAAAIVDMLSGATTMVVGEIKEMQQKAYDIPHPSSKHLRPSSENECRSLKVLECLESDGAYTIKISSPSKDCSKSVFAALDQENPCQSTHKIKASVSVKGNKQEELHLCFPYPVVADELYSKPDPSGKSTQLILTKATYEPWPSDFKEQFKWNVEEFTPFKLAKPGAIVDPLLNHLKGQFGESFRKNPPWEPMEDVRHCIAGIFANATQGSEKFAVYGDEDCKRPLWYIHARLPIVKSPQGAPVLIMTAVDLELSNKSTANSNLNAKQTEKDFERIWGVGITKGLIQYPMATREGGSILRHVLRANSIKMRPTKWQQENLPTYDYSPFLATFLTPLYLDNQHPNIEDVEFDLQKRLMTAFGSSHVKPSSVKITEMVCSAAGCSVQSSGQLKRCSKCKIAYYCSVECQRSDWKTHKLTCFSG